MYAECKNCSIKRLLLMFIGNYNVALTDSTIYRWIKIQEFRNADEGSSRIISLCMFYFSVVYLYTLLGLETISSMYFLKSKFLRKIFFIFSTRLIMTSLCVRIQFYKCILWDDYSTS